MKIKVGSKLKEVREDRQLNQAEMAELLGVSTSAYARVEKNQVAPTFDQLYHYAERLGIGVQDLLPETLSVNNTSDNQSGGGVIFGNTTHNYYYYGIDFVKEKDETIQGLKTEIEELKKEIQNLKKK